MNRVTDDYEDIIGLPHHVSKTHPPMPVADRAAQFASFAALTGFGEAVEETARTVDGMQTRDEARPAGDDWQSI